MQASIIGVDFTADRFWHPVTGRYAFTRTHDEIDSSTTRVAVAKTETVLAGWQYDLRWTFLDALEFGGETTDRTEL